MSDYPAAWAIVYGLLKIWAGALVWAFLGYGLLPELLMWGGAIIAGTGGAYLAAQAIGGLRDARRWRHEGAAE